MLLGPLSTAADDVRIFDLPARFFESDGVLRLTCVVSGGSVDLILRSQGVPAPAGQVTVSGTGILVQGLTVTASAQRVDVKATGGDPAVMLLVERSQLGGGWVEINLPLRNVEQTL